MALGRRYLIVEPLSLFRVKRQRELRGPVQLVARVCHRVVAVARARQTEGNICRVCRDLTGDDALAHVVFVRQTQVLRRGDVAPACAAIAPPMAEVIWS